MLDKNKMCIGFLLDSSVMQGTYIEKEIFTISGSSMKKFMNMTTPEKYVFKRESSGKTTCAYVDFSDQDNLKNFNFS